MFVLAFKLHDFNFNAIKDDDMFLKTLNIYSKRTQRQ